MAFLTITPMAFSEFRNARLEWWQIIANIIILNHLCKICVGCQQNTFISNYEHKLKIFHIYILYLIFQSASLDGLLPFMMLLLTQRNKRCNNTFSFTHVNFPVFGDWLIFDTDHSTPNLPNMILYLCSHPNESFQYSVCIRCFP